jgi:RNA-directed DNA polymerase
MGGKRQKRQLELAFPMEGGGEAPDHLEQGVEPSMAKYASESTASTQVMEEVCSRENMLEAYKRVKRNKGSPGVDGLTVQKLLDHLKGHWKNIREQLLLGGYQPQPVRQVEIPKPSGGVRKLGIPTVVDRLIQQAILQVLQKEWDPTFSKNSFGFRPGRSAHQAVRQAQQYIRDGCEYVVDLDLEKFFDRVNHDILMDRVAKRVKDKRLLRLIRRYLEAGLMQNGLASIRTQGMPQGGPLSPLLSNLLLDELDRELESRGHRFCRYADDSNIYVRSQRAGERVMLKITRFLERRLRLKVNQSKSAVAHPWKRKFLGFTFSVGNTAYIRVAPASVKRLKTRIRELSTRNRGRSFEQVIGETSQYLRGWQGYYGIVYQPWLMRKLDGWIRRKLRCLAWTQWKTFKNRSRELRKRGIHAQKAAETAATRRGAWFVSKLPGVQRALSVKHFQSIGLIALDGYG